MKLLRFEYNQKYISFDFETVSLGLSSGDIEIQAPYQLGWSLHQGNKHISNYEDWILWPDLIQKMNKWGAKARFINKFTEHEYKMRAKDPTPILDRFEKYFLDKSYISISANGVSFDGYVYNIYRHLLNRPINNDWFYNHVDVQCIYKANFLKIPFPKVGTEEWGAFLLKMSNVVQKGLKPNVAALCEEYNIPYDSTRHHSSSSYDSSITFQIFQKQISTYNISI